MNKEIGKEPNKTRIVEPDNNIELIPVTQEITPIKRPGQEFPSRNPVKRPVKQNYVVQQMIKDIVDEEMKEKLQNLDFTQDIEEVFPVVSDASENYPDGIENRDRIVITDERVDAGVNDFDQRGPDRLILERSMGRSLKRGALRFTADV